MLSDILALVVLLAIVNGILYLAYRWVRGLIRKLRPPKGKGSSHTFRATVRSVVEEYERPTKPILPKPTGKEKPAFVPAGATMREVLPDEVVHLADPDRLSVDPPASRLHLLTCADGMPALINFGVEEEWIDVLAPRSKRASYADLGWDDITRFGFTRVGSRWSYGEGPPNAREIRAALRTLDPTIQGRERM